MPLDPSRTVAELGELRELTGDDDGAQRVAWTDTWETARGWLRDKLAATGARIRQWIMATPFPPPFEQAVIAQFIAAQLGP